MTILTTHDGATFTQRDTTNNPQALRHHKDDTVTFIFNATAHSNDAVLAAYLQRLFHPPPLLHTITIIFAPPHLILPPKYLL